MQKSTEGNMVPIAVVSRGSLEGEFTNPKDRACLVTGETRPCNSANGETDAASSL